MANKKRITVDESILTESKADRIRKANATGEYDKWGGIVDILETPEEVEEYLNKVHADRKKYFPEEFSNEGVSIEDDDFKFDFEKDNPKDIINLVQTGIYKSNIYNNTYYFGYKFNSNISSEVRGKFIKFIKCLNKEGVKNIDEETLKLFIEKPFIQLEKNKKFTSSISAVVYPKSNRTNINREIIKSLRDYVVDAKTIFFELIKNIPANIEFDEEGFIEDFKGTEVQLKERLDYIRNTLMPEIHSCEYFSIAEKVKPVKYRSYIKNYLKFNSEEDKKIYESLQGVKVLIVDDINTTQSTLNSIIKVLKTINPSNELYIYTLIKGGTGSGELITEDVNLPNPLIDVVGYLKAKYGVTNTLYYGSGYILPDGQLLDISNVEHKTVLQDLVDKGVRGIDVYRESAPILHRSNLIRFNTKLQYVVLNEDEPTSKQESMLGAVLDYCISKEGWITVYTPQFDSIVYRYPSYDGDEVLKKIDKYYACNKLTECLGKLKQNSILNKYTYETYTLKGFVCPKTKEGFLQLKEDGNYMNLMPSDKNNLCTLSVQKIFEFINTECENSINFIMLSPCIYRNSLSEGLSTEQNIGKCEEFKSSITSLFGDKIKWIEVEGMWGNKPDKSYIIFTESKLLFDKVVDIGVQLCIGNSQTGMLICEDNIIQGCKLGDSMLSGNIDTYGEFDPDKLSEYWTRVNKENHKIDIR